eukprot:CAMPEP_0179282302 /NCGR_PEP_ID=MMETSP0797-20121207/37600_1 /TAXON_ID=47934 /ORGANISM="Dinophysis acuminata, Strain DAEP01" /LENGTH=91 /DNA_ID=CAMNT_0020991039 /DNA_START=60 /DNA_END=332 /DNA_ORIENTATION=-
MARPILVFIAMLLVTAGGSRTADHGGSADLSMPSMDTEGASADAGAGAGTADGLAHKEAAGAAEASANGGTGGGDDDDERLGLGESCGMPD